jgi:hemin uptake protein HemP
MADAPTPPRDITPPAYQSQDLFRGGKVVLIVHEGREYWLRITGAGKLILTA